MCKIWIQYTNPFKSYGMETIFQNWKRAITPKIIGGFYPKSNLTTFYDYIPVHIIWIQYTDLCKRYRTETIFQSWKFSKSKKGHNSQNNWCFSPLIEPDLHFMIIYLCIKISIQYTNLFKRYRTETICVTYGTDGRDGWTGRMDKWTDRTDGRMDSSDTICPPLKMVGA